MPVLPVLKLMLDNYRQHLEGLPDDENLGRELKPHDWIFAGERRGTSLNLPNLVRRVIVPLLTRCKVCHAAKHLHAKKDHAFDWMSPFLSGRASFRRSLATNLYTRGVKPKVIQAILRHSDIGTTLSYYVETPEAETREALDKLTELMK